MGGGAIESLLGWVEFGMTVWAQLLPPPPLPRPPFPLFHHPSSISHFPRPPHFFVFVVSWNVRDHDRVVVGSWSGRVGVGWDQAGWVKGYVAWLFVVPLNRIEISILRQQMSSCHSQSSS